MNGSTSSAFSLRLPPTAHLGDWTPKPRSFPHLENIFQEFNGESFKKLSEHEKLERVNRILLEIIQKTSHPCFLLPSVLDFIDRINKHGFLDHYTMASFELFLNQLSGLSQEDNYLIRAKIVGKRILRERYQDLFPVSTGKLYPGSHFITAHSSPDLDTTVASFWGWVDAFGCRVSEGFHVWNVPGGPPEGVIEIGFLFHKIFGPDAFQYLAKTRSSLAVTGIDLMTQNGMILKTTTDSWRGIDHERMQKAVVLVDEKGYYVGDWRSFDVEGVRQIVVLLCNSLQWFEHLSHAELIDLFGRAELNLNDVQPLIEKLGHLCLSECRPVQDLAPKQKESLHAFITKVLRISSGIEVSMRDFAASLEKMQLSDFHEFFSLLDSLSKSNLFDKSGCLVENRPQIFAYLDKVIDSLEAAIQNISAYVDRLDVALCIKSLVLGNQPHSVSSRADIEEIRSKMGTYPYLTITGSDSQGNLTPLGIIPAGDLFRPILGTVTLRDFCNRDETKIPSYLEVISVIDHHKSTLQTSAAPVVTISNAQSSNSMVAELAFAINDGFSTGGMARDEIAGQIQDAAKDLSTPSKRRILQRLLQRQTAIEQSNSFFIDPSREFVEYLHFLFAILDDTDLLTKVSIRDVECVASLINRMKSLTSGKEIEAVNFDDIPHNEKFAQAAARRLLQNPELYSLYHKIYSAKEEAVEENIRLTTQGKPSTFFADTKVQNGICRVGQAKMFAGNFPLFQSHADAIRTRWWKEAQTFQHDRPECDLHLHMISTLAGAEDLYHGSIDNFSHLDELWVWIPMNESAIGHLKTFLNGFKSLPQLQNSSTQVEFLGDNAHEFEQIFTESFMSCPHRAVESSMPIAVIRFKAGTINSRKAQVSPFLPKQVS